MDTSRKLNCSKREKDSVHRKAALVHQKKKKLPTIHKLHADHKNEMQLSLI